MGKCQQLPWQHRAPERAGCLLVRTLGPGGVAGTGTGCTSWEGTSSGRSGPRGRRLEPQGADERAPGPQRPTTSISHTDTHGASPAFWPRTQPWAGTCHRSCPPQGWSQCPRPTGHRFPGPPLLWEVVAPRPGEMGSSALDPLHPKTPHLRAAPECWAVPRPLTGSCPGHTPMATVPGFQQRDPGNQTAYLHSRGPVLGPGSRSVHTSRVQTCLPA